MAAPDTYARFAKFYDAYTAHYTADLPLYLALAAASAPPILEVGCGSGRVLLALLQAGHAVTGVDISPDMLALAQRKLAPWQAAVTLLNHNYAGGPLSEKFGLALVTYYTFNYLSPAERLAFLTHIGRDLEPGASIALHLFYPAALAAPQRAGQWQARGRYSLEAQEVSLLDCRRMVAEGAEARRQRFQFASGACEEIETIRYYIAPAALAELLAAAGFDRPRLAQHFTLAALRPLAAGPAPAGEYLLVAEKRAGQSPVL